MVVFRCFWIGLKHRLHPTMPQPLSNPSSAGSTLSASKRWFLATSWQSHQLCLSAATNASVCSCHPMPTLSEALPTDWPGKCSCQNSYRMMVCVWPICKNLKLQGFFLPSHSLNPEPWFLFWHSDFRFPWALQGQGRIRRPKQRIRQPKLRQPRFNNQKQPIRQPKFGNQNGGIRQPRSSATKKLVFSTKNGRFVNQGSSTKNTDSSTTNGGFDNQEVRQPKNWIRRPQTADSTTKVRQPRFEKNKVGLAHHAVGFGNFTDVFGNHYSKIMIGNFAWKNIFLKVLFE